MLTSTLHKCLTVIRNKEEPQSQIGGDEGDRMTNYSLVSILDLILEQRILVEKLVKYD